MRRSMLLFCTLCYSLLALEQAAEISSDLMLTEDLIFDSTGDGLVVAANGITIDGNGHALICTGPMGTEMASHDSTTVAGIRLGSHRNVTIKNFSRISGFYAGVEASGGRGNRIESCTFDGCGRGVRIGGGSLTVSDCTINNAFIALEATYYAGAVHYHNNIIRDCVWSIRYAGGPSGSCQGNLIERCVDRDTEHGSGGAILAGMLVERGRPVTAALDEQVQLDFSLRSAMAAAAPEALLEARVVPTAELTIDRDGAAVSCSFIPQRPGLHHLLVTVTDTDDNTTRHRYPIQVGVGALRQADCIFRHDGPFYGQCPDRWDTGSMSFDQPVVEDVVKCGGWTQFSPNDLPTSPVAVITGGQVRALLGFKTDRLDQFDNRWGLQRLATFNSLHDSVADMPEDFAETDFPGFFEWGAFDFDPVSWSMDEPHAWHAVTVKLIGRFPQVQCGKPDQLSRMIFDYQVPVTPEVTRIGDRQLRLLAATSATDGQSDAELIVAGPAPATELHLADWPYAFLQVPTTISEAGTVIDLPAVDDEQSFHDLPLHLLTDGAATMTVDSWTPTEPEAARWHLVGSGNLLLTVAELAGDSRYRLIDDSGSLIASADSDMDGSLVLDLSVPTTTTTMLLQQHVDAPERHRHIELRPTPTDGWRVTPTHGSVRKQGNATVFELLTPTQDYSFESAIPPDGDG